MIVHTDADVAATVRSRKAARVTDALVILTWMMPFCFTHTHLNRKGQIIRQIIYD